jgi:shikimate dehydrogenase
MQAVVAVEKFLDTEISKDVADKVFEKVRAEKENVVLTGMPGSGKSTVGRLLKIDGYGLFDTDTEVEKRAGCSIKELIEKNGEQYFRDLETDVIRQLSSESKRIISTGGGAVLRAENVRRLRRNGKVFFLDAPISRLCATEDRPLSDTREKLVALYEQRIDVYRACADVTVADMGSAEAEAEYILSKRTEKIV